MSRRQQLTFVVAGLIVLLGFGLFVYWARPVDESPRGILQSPSPTAEIEPVVAPSTPAQQLASPEEGMTPDMLELIARGLPIEGCDERKQLLDGKSEQDFKQIMKSAAEILSESDDPEYLLAAALMDFDRDGNAESPLLSRAMAQLPNHPVALWHRLQHCQNDGCDRDEIARAAVTADPTNGLLWLEIASGHLREGDWLEAEKAIRPAIASSRFDTYFLDYASLIERGLAASTDFDYPNRIMFGIGIAAAVAIPSFGDVSRACQSEENDAVAWVPLCEELGKSMHERSRELITSMIGWGYRRAAAERAGDKVRVQQLKEEEKALRQRYVDRQVKGGAAFLLENDPAVLRDYVDDFRAHGELAAIDRLVEVAERLRNDETYDQCNFVSKRPPDAE